MKWLKNFERLLEIQRNIVWPSVFELDPKIYIPDFLKPALTRQPCDRIIVSPRRQIILEGPLQIWDTGKPQEMYVVLFDDMLLITRRKKGLSKKVSIWYFSTFVGTITGLLKENFSIFNHEYPIS